ncbi:MAG: hypothetical protein NUW37_05395 [Planctomycetes bacterium]|nr:hypothetical protein [Planctomycetota bacterium]
MSEAMRTIGSDAELEASMRHLSNDLLDTTQKKKRRRKTPEDTKSPRPYAHHVRGAMSEDRNPYQTRYVADLIRKIDIGKFD